jgi:malate dehydrogenase
MVTPLQPPETAECRRSGHKITVVGAGMVGSSTAMRIGEQGLCDELVLVDVVEGIAEAMALDIGQALPFAGSDTLVSGGVGYEATAGSDVVVITAGLPRKPGQSRADLLEANGKIVATVSEEIRARSPEAVVIVVTNPLDEMTALAQRLIGFPPERVVGMAGMLDTARFRAFVAWHTKTPPSRVEALTLGSHGETMVPVPRLSNIRGRPLPEVLPASEIDALVERTRDGGAEIVRLLKRGSAWWAPSAAISAMVRAIVDDERSVMPVSAYCRGEFGIDGVYVGVPARLGRGGVVEIVDLGLTPEEIAGLRAAAAEVSERVAELDRILAGAKDEAPPAERSAEAPAAPRPARDLALESKVRTAARSVLAKKGDLDRLDEVVEQALAKLR